MTSDTEPVYNRTYEIFKRVGWPRPFVTFLTVSPGTSRMSTTHTWEDTGEHFGKTVVLVIPFTRIGVGLGYWKDVDPSEIVPVHLDDAEYDAYVAVNGPVPREKWERAREVIAAQDLDPSEEMEMMQALGVFQ